MNKSGYTDLSNQAIKLFGRMVHSCAYHDDMAIIIFIPDTDCMTAISLLQILTSQRQLISVNSFAFHVIPPLTSFSRFSR